MRHAVWSAVLLALMVLPLLVVAPVSWSPAVALPLAEAWAPVQRISIEVTGGGEARVSLAQMLLRVWLGVALLLGGRVAWEQWRAGGLAARASAWPELGPEVRCSGEIRMPAACGFWRPRVVLPEEARGWTPERLRLVLLHERLHLARHDTRWHVLSRLTAALYWFHPLVWYASARLRAESEQACDDAVLLTGEEAPVYATHLVEIARSVRFDRPIPEGGIPMARMSQLEERLRSLFNPAANRAAVTGRLLTALALATAAAVVPLSAVQTAVEPRSAQPGITGSVKDPSGALVADAKIRVSSADGQRIEVGRSGDDGAFLIAPIPEGLWSIEVTKPGFARLLLEKVQIAGAAPTPLQLTLHMGGLRESMSVIGDVPAAPTPAAATPASATAATAKRLRMGGGVMAAKLLKRVPPQYPPECKADRVQGTVLLRAVISKAGAPLSLEPMNRLVDGRLVESAIAAVQQWRWEPTLLNGEPVEIMTEIEINYTLMP
jgi:hypothetical protein